MYGMLSVRRVEQELNKRLTSAPVLILPNPKESFIMYCNVSKMGLGGVLI